MDEPAAAAPATGWLARYQPWRRRAEIGFGVGVLGLQALFNSVVSWIDLHRAGRNLPYWQPLAWEKRQMRSDVPVGVLLSAGIDQYKISRLCAVRCALVVQNRRVRTGGDNRRVSELVCPLPHELVFNERLHGVLTHLTPG